MERFRCVLHQENGHGASEKTTLVYHRFLNDNKEKTNNFWRPEKLAICAILWYIFHYVKRLGRAIAGAVSEWCIAEKQAKRTPKRLRLSVFPIESDRDFFEQHERSSKLPIAKRIMKKGAFFIERWSPKRL